MGYCAQSPEGGALRTEGSITMYIFQTLAVVTMNSLLGCNLIFRESIKTIEQSWYNCLLPVTTLNQIEWFERW